MKEYRKVSLRLMDHKYRVTVEGQRSCEEDGKGGSPSLGTHDSGARSGLTASFHLFGRLLGGQNQMCLLR